MSGGSIWESDIRTMKIPTRKLKVEIAAQLEAWNMQYLVLNRRRKQKDGSIVGDRGARHEAKVARLRWPRALEREVLDLAQLAGEVEAKS